MLKKLSLVLLLSFFNNAQAQNLEEFTVENIYFHMGVVAAFAEVVNMDVKQIGLSEMSALGPAAAPQTNTSPMSASGGIAVVSPGFTG